MGGKSVMKKKTILLASSIGAIALVALGTLSLAGETGLLQPVAGGAATPGDYALNLTKDTVIVHNDGKYVTSTSGNQIWFNVDDFLKGTTNFGSLAAGKAFWNITAIHSISTINASIASGNIHVYYAWTANWGQTWYDSGITLSSSVSTADLSSFAAPYVQFLAADAAVINTLTINYHCPNETSDSHAETAGVDGYENLPVSSRWSSSIAEHYFDTTNVADSGSKRSLKVTFAGQTDSGGSWPWLYFDMAAFGKPALTQGHLIGKIKLPAEASVHHWTMVRTVDTSNNVISSSTGFDFGTADANGFYDLDFDVSKFATTNPVAYLGLGFKETDTSGVGQSIYIDRLGIDTGYETMGHDPGWETTEYSLTTEDHALDNGLDYRCLKLLQATGSNNTLIFNPAWDSIQNAFKTVTKMEFDMKASVDSDAHNPTIRAIDNNWKSSAKSNGAVTAGSNGWYHVSWSGFDTPADGTYSKTNAIIRIVITFPAGTFASGASVLVDNVQYTGLTL
jgi:hypothetical protein